MTKANPTTSTNAGTYYSSDDLGTIPGVDIHFDMATKVLWTNDDGAITLVPISDMDPSYIKIVPY